MNSIWAAKFIEYDFHLVQRLCMLGLDKRLSVPGASGYTNFPIQHLSFLFSPSLQGSNFKQSKKYSSFPQAHISSYPQSITHFQHLHQFEIVWSRTRQSLFRPPLRRRPSAVQLTLPVRIWTIQNENYSRCNFHLVFPHGGKNNNGNLLLKLHLLIGLETTLHVNCQPRHLHRVEIK